MKKVVFVESIMVFKWVIFLRVKIVLFKFVVLIVVIKVIVVVFVEFVIVLVLGIKKVVGRLMRWIDVVKLGMIIVNGMFVFKRRGRFVVFLF